MLLLTVAEPDKARLTSVSAPLPTQWWISSKLKVSLFIVLSMWLIANAKSGELSISVPSKSKIMTFLFKNFKFKTLY